MTVRTFYTSHHKTIIWSCQQILGEQLWTIIWTPFTSISPRSVCPRSSPDYFIRCRQEGALDALLDTLSPEQRDLYLRYEEFRNDLSSIEAEQLFRETFRLTRELYR